jgi:hypothetical protein
MYTHGSFFALRLRHLAQGHPLSDTVLRQRASAERSAGDAVQHSGRDLWGGGSELKGAGPEDGHGPDNTHEGLLERVPKPDARVKSLRLSKKGGQVLKEAFPLWAAAQKEMLARITPEVWVLLAEQLEDLSSESV